MLGAAKATCRDPPSELFEAIQDDPRSEFFEATNAASLSNVASRRKICEVRGWDGENVRGRAGAAGAVGAGIN